MHRYVRAAGWRSIALIAVMAAGATAACSKAQGSSEGGGGRAGGRGRADDAAKSVKAEAVRKEDVRRSVDITGTLAAEDQVTISSQSDGAVSRILADLGDHVRSGQVLIELDREKL